MRLVLLVCLALPTFAFAHCADEPDLSDLTVDARDFSPDLQRDVQESTEARSSTNFDSAQTQRGELILNSAEHSLRRIYRRYLYGDAGRFVRDIQARKDWLELIPFTVTTESRTLVAFTRRCRGSITRVALFADGTVERINSASEFRALIVAALQRSHCSLELQCESTADEDRAFESALSDLNSDDFDLRQSASARLELAGLKALPLLTLGAHSNDPERRNRCVAVLARLEQLFAMRSCIVDLRKELGLAEAPDPGRPAIPASIQLLDDAVLVGDKRYSIGSLRRSFPDIYAGLFTRE